MAAIEIGGISSTSHKLLAETILKIVNSHQADSKVKTAALKALEAGVKQGNHTISNCNFTGV